MVAGHKREHKVMKVFAFLICLCSVLSAVDYATLSDSKIYQKWLKDAQSKCIRGMHQSAR